MNGTVTIINYNRNAHSIVSAAGRISTTKGCADDIYQNSCSRDEDDNLKLINKILSSGHESVLEHVMVNLSFNNVSVLVEQFMIEFRLAAFTVKSRRYVDFGEMGYVEPEFAKYENQKEIEEIYHNHMEFLFKEYDSFLENGIPKEDARFVLPYSFRSNFYCTVNARELTKIVNEMVYGRGKEIPEFAALGESLFQQCEEILPYIKRKKDAYTTGKRKNILQLLEHNKRENVREEKELISVLYSTPSPEEHICRAAALDCGIIDWQETDIGSDEEKREIIKNILANPRKRELEQVNFTVLFHKISLAGITHLVRHRMQSIIVPDYVKMCDFGHFVLPDSIVDGGLADRYKQIFEKSGKVYQELEEKGFISGERAYLMLSGLTLPVVTTMNANELATFIRLRTCNRAQWEIKQCADEILTKLRKLHPVLFSLYGPTCFMIGKCSEGKMSCGKMDAVLKEYTFLH